MKILYPFTYFYSWTTIIPNIHLYKIQNHNHNHNHNPSIHTNITTQDIHLFIQKIKKYKFKPHINITEI